MKKGDNVFFKIKASAYAVQRGTVMRKIVGFTSDNRIMVRFAGYDEYVLRHDEVIRTEEV